MFSAAQVCLASFNSNRSRSEIRVKAQPPDHVGVKPRWPLASIF
jgi:hypothetical protein